MDNFLDKLAPRSRHAKPMLLEFRSSKAFITFVVSYAVFADQFIFAIIVPVMPFTLHNQVGISEDSVQYWVSILLAVFGAATTVASPIWGWVTDRTSSRRLPFLCGLLVITAATIMIWFAHSIALQVLGRVLQGLSSAVVWVTGLAMIADTVDQKQVGQYVGYLGIAMMVGTLVAPLLGGIILAKAGYNAVFETTIAIIGFDILLRFITIEKKAALKWSPPPTPPTPLEDAPAELSRVEEPKTSSTREIVQFSAPGEDTTANPIERKKRLHLPAVITLLSSRRLLVALWASLMVGAIFSGLESVLPLQVEDVFGWGPIGAGLIFLPLTIPAFGGPAVGWVCDRYGSRWPVSFGFFLLCPILTLLLLVDHNSINQKVLLCALLTIVGCCFTLTLDPTIAEVAYIVEQKSEHDLQKPGNALKAYAQAFGLFNMAYSLGNTVGPVLAGLIRENCGWTTTSWVLGLVCGVTAIPVALYCGGWLGKKVAARRDDGANHEP